MADLRILIADDHELIRRGLRDLLTKQPGWQVVGEASDGAAAVAMATRIKPDIVILDFFMPGLNGHAAAALILEKLPGTGIVVLTMDDSEQVIRAVLQAGVRALVLKSDTDRDLLAAIRSVSEKDHFFAGRVAKVVFNNYWSGKPKLPPGTGGTSVALTEREREVMRLLATGMKSKDIAAQLQISIRTVEAHRTNMNRKLSFHSIADLVRYAIRNGIAMPS